jgi:ribosomal protein S18 acetylase RimI-like enzyme
VIHYRPFRNTDPPALADIWNAAFTQRGAVRMRTSSPLEFYAYAKPYFDPAGLIVAEEDGVGVGFVHAGFGPNADETALATDNGVTCLVAVRPTHRRRGVGTELLRHSEAYLTGRGARTLYAGLMWPLSPFYYGLYGGSEASGILLSDAEAEPFLLSRGYQVAQTDLVFQRPLDGAVNVADGRFPALRARFEVNTVPPNGTASWYRECVHGPVELLEFRLEEKATGQVVARASVWEMEGFWRRWNEPVVGVLGIEVREDWRRKGLAKFLLTQLLRQLQEQYFAVAEVHVKEQNKAGVQLLRALGFEQVDAGRMYKK